MATVRKYIIYKGLEPTDVLAGEEISYFCRTNKFLTKARYWNPASDLYALPL
jgi:hypothetical protein